jgi:hypothetical protein
MVWLTNQSACRKIAPVDYKLRRGHDVDMADEIAMALDACRRELFESAAMLRAVQDVFGAKVRDQTMKAYGRLLDAHFLLTGVHCANNAHQ